MIGAPGEHPVWLVDLDVGGSLYRYSSDVADVETNAGEDRPYFGGLHTDLSVSLRGGSISLTLGADVDWSEVVARGAALELARVVIRRWWPGQTLEQARVVLRGRVTSATYGGRGEALELTCQPEAVAASRAAMIPPATAQVLSESSAADEGTAVTWPISGPLYFAPSVSLGRYYPWVIGLPGDAGPGAIAWDAVLATSVEGAPASSQLWLCIAGHRVQATEVRIKDALDPRPFAGAQATVAYATDGLGREIAYVDAVAAGLTVNVEEGGYRVGYSIDHGGGLVGTDGRLIRGVGQLIDYIHREWVQGSSLDIGRHAAWSAQLDQYLIDTYIDDPVDALEWLSNIISTLPIDRIDGPSGYYWRPRLIDPALARPRANLSADAGTVSRETSIIRDGVEGVVNEVVVEYGRARNSSRKSRSVTAEAGKLSDTPTWFGWLDDVDRVLPSLYAARSQSMYGVRQVRVEFPTYDDTTALRIAEQILVDGAIPHRRVTYRGGYELESLEPGDAITLTDSGVGLSAAVCRIDDVVLSGAVVDLALTILSEPAAGESRATS